MEEGCLHMCSPWLAQPTSHTTQDYLLQAGIAHRALGLSISVINLENAYRVCHWQLD